MASKAETGDVPIEERISATSQTVLDLIAEQQKLAKNQEVTRQALAGFGEVAQPLIDQYTQHAERLELLERKVEGLLVAVETIGTALQQMLQSRRM